MSPAALTEELKAAARRLGFDMAGACPAVEPPGLSRFAAWLEAGYAGQMQYLERRRQAYAHPGHVLDGVRSILMLAINYRSVEPAGAGPGQGRISRYAWGDDYHDLIRDRLNRLAAYLAELVPEVRVRGVVDTAPLLEREFAQLAGLGWIGKNTLLLSRDAGSWFFLAALLTDAELAYEASPEADHCGRCTACLEACPTDAFVAPYVLDSRRCISYLTIELKTSMPAELRTGLGDWLFGCDVCQDVCPWNRRAPLATERAFEPARGANPVDLIGLFKLSDAEFRLRFRHTPLWRPKRRGILRNAAVVLGNRPHADALPALAVGLGDGESLVRGACAWALGRYSEAEAEAALRRRLAVENDVDVRTEIEAALT